jgi:hypothetical protein
MSIFLSLIFSLAFKPNFFAFGVLYFVCKKSKAVPLHAMEAHGGRGGIASTHT